MTEDLKQKMIDKIQKLLRLAGSANEHEAALAAERAQALLVEYNLSMDDVETKEEKAEDKFVVNSDIETDSLPWRRQIAVNVAKLYFCTYFYTHVKKFALNRKNGYIRFDKHSFVGAPHNIAVAKMMFKYLDDTVERLAAEGSLRFPMQRRSSYRTSFKTACALRLGARIRQRIEATKQQGVKTESGRNLPALASLYDQTNALLAAFLEKEIGKMGSQRRAPNSMNMDGWRDGREAGDKISLERQIGQKEATHLLTN